MSCTTRPEQPASWLPAGASSRHADRLLDEHPAPFSSGVGVLPGTALRGVYQGSEPGYHILCT